MPHLPAAVLFDMDGTLIDSEGLWHASEIHVMATLGSSWSEDDQAHCLGGPLERVGEYMVRKSGTDRPASAVMDLLLGDMEVRLRDNPLAWRPGARDLLAEARAMGVPTALVSASYNSLIDAVQHRIEQEIGGPAFDVVVAGDDVQNSKPHPEPYRTAAARLGLEPAQCLALEDSPTGVASAVAAGCVVVAIPHIAEIDTYGATVVTSLAGRTLADLWAEARQG